MPISLRPDRGDVPQLGDPAFDALLARTLRPEEAVASLRPMVESFAALYAAPVPSGPAAEASALNAFRAVAATGASRPAAARPGAARPGAERPGAGRRSGPRLARFRLGVAAAVAVLVAGAAAVAYTGGLPAPMQQVAHVVIGAPAGQHVPRPAPGHPVASPLPGNAAYGLCRAYERALAHGDPGHNPVLLRRLATAAGGAGQVRAYCARVIHPGNPAAGQPAHAPHGKPSTAATPPTHHGKPSRAATPHGKPTG